MDSETVGQVPQTSPEQPHIKPYRKHCLPLGFVIFGGSYLVQFPIIIVLAIVSALFLGSADAMGMDWLNIWVELFLAIYTIVTLFALGGSKPFRCRVSEFLSGIKGSLYLIVFALILVVYTVCGGLASGMTLMEGWPVTLIKVLVLCVLIGIYEEGIFRGVIVGCLLPRMGKSKAGVFGAVFLACAIFGVAHVSFGEELTPMVLAQLVLKFIQSGMLGFFFTGLAISTGNIWPGVFAHAFWDFSLMGSGGLFEDPFDVSYVDTSSDGWTLVVFYIVMIVLQLPMVITAAMRIAKAAPTCGWLASVVTDTDKEASQENPAPYAPAQGAPFGQSESQPMSQSAPKAYGLAPTQDAGPGSSAWYARRSPDAPPPPKGWQG